MKISYVAGILAVAGLATARMEVKRGAEHDSSIEKAIQEGKWIENLWGEDAYKHHDGQKAENKWDSGKSDDKSDSKNDGKDDDKNDDKNKGKDEGKNDDKNDNKDDGKKDDQDNDQKKPEEHNDDQKKPDDHKEEQGHKDKCGYTPEEKEKFIASGKYDPCLFG